MLFRSFIDADTDEEEHHHDGVGSGASQRLLGRDSPKQSSRSGLLRGANHLEASQRLVGNSLFPLEGRGGGRKENHVIQDVRLQHGEQNRSGGKNDNN